MKVAIFAAGGLGKVVCEALKMGGGYEIIGFFDDNKKGTFSGYPIIGKCNQYKRLCCRFDIEAVFVAFGYNFLDKRIFYCKKIAHEKVLSFVNAIHPKAIISNDVRIGKGIYIGPGVIINPGTMVGDYSIIWSGTIIEHDNFIGKNVFITPGIRTAGYVKIGDNSFVGMGSNILKANIGKNVTIGAGSLVTGDIKSNRYVFGIPAKIIKTKKSNSYV